MVIKNRELLFDQMFGHLFKEPLILMYFSQNFFMRRRDQMSRSGWYLSGVDVQPFWVNILFNCFEFIIHMLCIFQSTLDVIITESKFRALPLTIKVNKFFIVALLCSWVYRTGRIVTILAEELGSQKKWEKLVTIKFNEYLPQK